LRDVFARIEKRSIISLASLFFASFLAFHDYLSYEPLPETIENDVSLDPHRVTIDEAQDGEAISGVVSPSQKISTVAFDEGKQEKLLVVGKGDTLKSLLVSAGLDKGNAQDVVDAIKKVYNPKGLKIGQGIRIQIGNDPHSGSVILSHMEWRSSPEQEITLSQSNGRYQAKKKAIELKKYIEGVTGKIHSSFYNTAVKLGAPSNLVRAAIQALSYEINFQHEPKPNNGLALLYEVYKDNKGNVVRYGNLLYAAIAVRGKLRQIYRYEGLNGASYYNHHGESVVRGFLRSPLDATKLRVSSGFGMRMHPVRGYTRMHKGVDFGAPPGTRVVAAGSGVVTKAQYWGDFGLYVSIRHGDYTTEYAHLRKIAPGIRPGSKIAQGQFIGEVGSTGSATGPHLHYGVLYKGSHINPNSIKMMPAQKMGKQDLAKFIAYRKSIDAHIDAKPDKEEYVFSIKNKHSMMS